jgi:hypothetical protein
MQQTAHSTATAPGKDKPRLRRAALILAVSAGLALGASACGGTAANSAASGATGNAVAGGTASSGSGQRSAGSFSLAFAKCMRARSAELP